MAMLTLAEIMEKSADGSLIEDLFAQQRDCLTREFYAFTDRLAELHNSGQIDLVNGLSPDILSRYSGMWGYRGQRVYEGVLGKLDISLETLLELIALLLDPTGDQRGIFKILSMWCRKRPDRIEQIFELVDSDDQRCESFQIVKAVISEACQFDDEHHLRRIYTFLEHPNPSYRIQTAQGMEYAHFQESSTWSKILDVMRLAVKRDRTDDLHSSLLGAAVCWFERAPEAAHSAIQAFVLEVAQHLTPSVTSKIVWTLSFNSRHMPLPLVYSLLTALQSASLQPDDCSKLDIFLEHLVKHGAAGRAQDFLERLILKDDGKSEHRLGHFQSVVQKLMQGEPATLNAWVIRWLRMGNQRLCNDIQQALFFGREEPYMFIPADLPVALEPWEYGFIARKAVGYLLYHYTSLASFLVMLGASAPAQQRVEIRDLLFDPVLINYPDLAPGYLTAIADSDHPAAGIVRSALGLHQDYSEGLVNVGSLNELKPPASHVQLEYERYSDQIQQAVDEGRKGSFLADIFVERTLLYGNGAISLVPADGKLQAVETEATHFSHKLELPRQYYYEPVALHHRLYGYKMESRS